MEQKPSFKKPWARTMLSGLDLIRSPKYNKGLAFTREERKAFHLEGLFPYAVSNQEQQVIRVIENVRKKSSPLEKYIYLISLMDRNENLFYYALSKNVEEIMPIIYTPTVGQACQEYGHIFRRPRGLFITIKDLGNVKSILKNWGERHVKCIVVTDGERILGLGDLGAYGMGIPVGKLSLYVALAGIAPQHTLPVMLDVGTENEEIRNDPLYVGIPERRDRSEKYDQLIEEFFTCVQKRFGASTLIQFEDFGNQNAFRLLEKYRKRAVTFNDDIQGTAAVTLSGILSSKKITNKKLSDNTFLFNGAGEAGVGIANLISLAISLEDGIPVEEARKRIFLFDSVGLVVKSRREKLAHHKLEYAHDHPEVGSLEEAVRTLKPSVLIGVSAMAGVFTEGICREMAANNERPVIFALSNPTSKAECTAAQAMQWTDGRVLYASGSPMPAGEHKGVRYVPGQGNNAYIFPGVGLGVLLVQATEVTERMFAVAAQALSRTVAPEDLEVGCLYPNLSRIRDVSAIIAAAVMEEAYRDKKANLRPRPADLVMFAKAGQYNPEYPRYA